MTTVQSYAQTALDFVHHSFLEVNTSVGLLVIALIAAILMRAWGQIFTMAFLAVLVDELWVAATPLLHRGRFQLPDFIQAQFWVNAFALYIGLFIVIAVFFFLKSLFVKPSKG